MNQTPAHHLAPAQASPQPSARLAHLLPHTLLLLWVMLVHLPRIIAHMLQLSRPAERADTNQQLQAERAERLRLEAALQAAEARYRALSEQMPVLSYVVQINAGAVNLSLSPQLEGLLGYAPEHFAAHPADWLELVHPDDRAGVRQRFDQLVTQRAAPSLDYRIRGQDGQERWLHDEARIAHSEPDGALTIQGILSDSTAHKQAERELFQRIELERLITSIASDFINASATTIDDEINRALAAIGSFASVDRSYVFIIDDHETMSNTHEWCADGIAPEIDELQHLPTTIFPWAMEQLSKRSFVHVPRVADLPPEAMVEREILELQAVRSVVWVPIASETRLIGFLGFDAVRSEKTWDMPSIALLQFVGTIFASALQRQRMERALQASERRYRTVVEQVGEVIFQTDALGRWTFLNPAWTEITGFSVEESLGKAFLDGVHPEEQQRCLELFLPLVVGQSDYCRYEVRYLTRNGSFRWIEVIARTWLDDTGKVVGTAGTLSDLTLHKQAEEVLRESELRFRQLAENIRDVFFISTPDLSQFFYVSPAYEEVWGHSCASLYAQPQTFLEQVQLEDRAAILDGLGRRMRGGEDLNVECRLVHGDGAQRWVKIRAFGVCDAAGNVYRLTGIAEEITERKHTEAALIQSNAELERLAQLKDEFLANMSHELRTPLNAILGLSEVLQEQIYGPTTDKQLTALKNIEESGRHLLALINDILDLSKIEASQLTLEIAPLDIAELCQTSMRLVKQIAHQKRLSTSIVLEEKLNRMCADERRLKQILVNLLSNAVKFTPEGGRCGLEVRLDEAAQQVIFTVWDTGIGISAADQRRLFQPFVQLDSRLARQHEGSGLGLALVHRLTRLHEGEIELESVPGQGSRFTVKIPYRQSAGLPAPDYTPASATTALELCAGEAPLILIAEDNLRNSAVIEAYLGALGFRTQTVTNGAQVVAQACATQPALMIVDIQMPDLNGIEAIRQVRATPAICATPIIVVTALAMQGDRERCLAAGANEYMSKPVQLRALQAQIVRLLDPPRQEP